MNKSTAGLKALIEARRYTPDQYLRAINSYPRFWNSLRPNTLKIDKHLNEINKGIANLNLLYPALTQVPIYFSMGVFRTNGTIKDDKILIGSEMALSGKSVDISELPDHPREFNEQNDPINDLPFLCVHEYVHTQQKELGDNLLSYVVYEGVAEFVASLSTGKASYVSAVDYVYKHHELVRDKFKEDLFIPSHIYDWLWSSNRVFGQRDLGYGVGYDIARRYHNHAQDKMKSIKEMIELDFTDDGQIERFINKSGYFEESLTSLREEFERLRPTVTHISGLTNGTREALPRQTKVTLHFSQPLNRHNTGLDFGPLGEDVLPEIGQERIWSSDGLSWSFSMELEPNQHYQLLISPNFRLQNDIPLKPYLIEFWTSN